LLVRRMRRMIQMIHFDAFDSIIFIFFNFLCDKSCCFLIILYICGVFMPKVA